MSDPVKAARELSMKASGGTSLQLPMWPDHSRRVPNEIVRSALFTTGNNRNTKVPREIFKNHPIVVVGDGDITYTGQELRTDDEDCWLQIIHLAKEQPLGHTVEITPYTFLKAMGWGNNPKAKAKLQETLSRLSATNLSVTSKRLAQTEGLSLIRGFKFMDQGRPLEKWLVTIEPGIKSLFGEKYLTSLQWEQRKKLSPTAKKLHGYYASHKHPFDIKIETLKLLCNSKIKVKTKLRQSLSKALDELINVGFLESGYIKDDKVYVVRS